MPDNINKPAPVAEEQLPQLPEWKTNNDIPADVWDEAMMFDADAPVAEWLVITRRQLLAAIRDNREKDAQLARQDGIIKSGSFYPPYKELETQLAEQDAQITELVSLNGKQLLLNQKALDKIQELEIKLKEKTK